MSESAVRRLADREGYRLRKVAGSDRFVLISHLSGGVSLGWDGGSLLCALILFVAATYPLVQESQAYFGQSLPLPLQRLRAASEDRAKGKRAN